MMSERPLRYDDLYSEVAGAEDEEDGIDVIYSRVDEAHRRGEFTSVDRVLAGVWEDLPMIYSLALLSITLPARGELREREGFARRLRARLVRDDPERVEQLLVGLE